MLVLGLGLGLESGPWPWPWPKAKAKDHFQDSVGQMLSCYTPVSITYTTALQVIVKYDCDVTYLLHHQFIYFMYPDGICAPWILV